MNFDLFGIRRRFRIYRRRERIAVDLDKAIKRAPSEKLRTKFRREILARERSRLGPLLNLLAKARTEADLDRVTNLIDLVQLRCEALATEEAAVERTVRLAEVQATELRRRAATFPGEALKKDARKRREAIVDLCKLARNPKDRDAEESTLAKISQRVGELEQLVRNADSVQKSIPDVEQQITAIPIRQVALDPGTEEIYQTIRATFEQTRADANRGDYAKAARRLSEIRGLHGNLQHRLNQRARWAREEVDLWVSSKAVTQRFPQILRFPGKMDGAHIEEWYSMRLDIERFVAERAANQRMANVPSVDSSSSRLDANHALRLKLDEIADEGKLRSFARAVSSYMGGLTSDAP